MPVAGGVATISSDDTLRLYDPLALNGGPLREIGSVNTGVTCLKAATEGDATVVFTAGQDGRVRLIDLRSGDKVGEVSSGELVILWGFRYISFLCVFLRRKGFLGDEGDG